MEKQTTCNSCRNRMAVTVMCIMSAVNTFAQNLQTTLGETWTGTTWENAFQSQNMYDANDYLTGTISQLWTTPPGQWDNAIRYTYTNNSTGAATEILLELWDSDANVWMTSQRVTNTLNGSDQVVTATTEVWVGTAWMNVSKQTNTYTGGYLATTLSQSWDFLSSSWVNSNLITYDNNPDGTVNEAVYQTWNPATSVWVNSSRSTYTYNGAGQELSELEQIWVGGNWQNESRITNTYVGGWLSTSLSEIWLMPSGVWQNDTQSLYTNNLNGTPAQVIVQEWNTGTSAWDNSARITFTYEGLGIGDLPTTGFAFYPNPVRDYINVKSKAAVLGDYSILDQQGRTVKNGTISDFESVIDVGGLSSGVYFFRLAELKKTIKFIKQ